MIDWLRTTLGAHFFVGKTRITKKAIRILFDDLHTDALNSTRIIFRVVREKREDIHFSGICFSYDRPVPFFAEEARKLDKITGFILLVEKGSTVALFKSGLDVTTAFKSAHLAPFDRTRVERAIARHDAIFEKMSLRNMSTSKLALRSKTLEARDLENAIPMSSAARYVPQNYRVRRGDDSYSATPSTGRIAVRADRADISAAISWAGEIVQLLADDAATSSAFISRFARPADLSKIPFGTVPTFFAVDTIALAEALWEANERVRFVREDQGIWRELTKPEVEAILADLDNPLTIVTDMRSANYELRGGETVVGGIKLNKARIALKSLDHPSVVGVFVEDSHVTLGRDPARQPLERYIDAEDMFTVLFSDLALAYINGALFRDEALLGGGTAFLRHLRVEPCLTTMTSEKGDFTENQKVFSASSVFRVVVDTVATEDVLLCDDLNDEWADFIGVASDAGASKITFYHAKHGNLSMSASAFHDAVGQAIKNLGRLALSGEAMTIKHRHWDTFYRNGGATTLIRRRIRGGSRDEVAEKVAEAAAAPDLQYQVVIVTSSLSKASVQAAFANATAGHAPIPSFVQLYWLLTGFFSACAEIGAVGFVVCQP